MTANTFIVTVLFLPPVAQQLTNLVVLHNESYKEMMQSERILQINPTVTATPV